MFECCYKTGMIFGTGLLTGAIGAGSGAFAAKMIGLKPTLGTLHGLVSGFCFGTTAKLADYVLPNGEEGKCHQISAWSIGFISGHALGYGSLRAVGLGLGVSHFFSMAALTSVVGASVLLGLKVAYNQWENRECCRRSITVHLPDSQGGKGSLLISE